MRLYSNRNRPHHLGALALERLARVESVDVSEVGSEPIAAIGVALNDTAIALFNQSHQHWQRFYPLCRYLIFLEEAGELSIRV